MSRLRVLIADDHPTFRYGLRALLSADAGIEVIGEAGDGAQAVRMTESLQPDVVLMDVGMPQMTGLEATEAILRRDPNVNILMLTMFDDDTVMSALRLGARGYLLKGASGDETLRAVHSAGGGSAVFSPSVGRRLAEFVRTAEAPAQPPPFPELSEREREILELLAHGLSNSAIAERLYLSPKTVRNRISEIFSKLEVADRSEAIVRARQAGMGSEPTTSRRS